MLRQFDVLDRRLSQIEREQRTIVSNRRVLDQSIRALQDYADSEAELDCMDAERAAAESLFVRGT